MSSWEAGKKLATRSGDPEGVGALLDSFPVWWRGAADLTGNTGVKLDGAERQSPEHPDGRQLYFGIREHAHGRRLVGMACHGGVLPVGGTFFVFIDYLRPPVRLAALEPRQVSSCSATTRWASARTAPRTSPSSIWPRCGPSPDLQVIRPADANETAAALRATVGHDGPTALDAQPPGDPGLHRRLGVEPRRRVSDRPTARTLVLVATGARSARASTRPRPGHGGHRHRWSACRRWDRFERQGADYRDVVLPPGCPVLSVEAATTFGWERCDARSASTASARPRPAMCLARLGINVDHVVETARSLVSEGN